MKHHCHCGFREHFSKISGQKLGFLGAFLFIAHLLFHVIECLVLPALIVGFTHHHAEPVQAEAEIVAAETIEPAETTLSSFELHPCQGLIFATNWQKLPPTFYYTTLCVKSQ